MKVCPQFTLAFCAQFADKCGMSYVDHILTRFGGVRAMARATGRATSTVWGWQKRGSIPDGEKPHVLACAEAAGLNLTREDFFPVIDPVRKVS